MDKKNIELGKDFMIIIERNELFIEKLLLSMVKKRWAAIPKYKEGHEFAKPIIRCSKCIPTKYNADDFYSITDFHGLYSEKTKYYKEGVDKHE